MSTQIHSHRSLNRIYSKDKVTAPPTLGVFMKFFCKFVLFYKPLNFHSEVQAWLQQLLQRLEESNIREKNISQEQLLMVLQQFEKEWDEDHVVDRNQILNNRADDDYDGADGENGAANADTSHRELPTPQFDKICVDFVREAIRYSPSELIKFAQRYFRALEAGKVEKYLQKMADQRAKLLPARLCSDEDMARAQVYLSESSRPKRGDGEDDGDDDDDGDHQVDMHADRGATIKMIQRTLAQEKDARSARVAAARAEAAEEAAANQAERKEQQARVEAALRENDIDLDAHYAEAQRERAEEMERRRRELEEDDEAGDGEGGIDDVASPLADVASPLPAAAAAAPLTGKSAMAAAEEEEEEEEASQEAEPEASPVAEADAEEEEVEAEAEEEEVKEEVKGGDDGDDLGEDLDE